MLYPDSCSVCVTAAAASNPGRACATPPPAASVGCCCPLHPPGPRPGPGLTRIRRPTPLLGPGSPDPDFRVGLWLVTAGPLARSGSEAAAAVVAAAVR